MEYPVQVKVAPARLVLARRVTVDAKDLGPTIGQTLGEAYGHLGQAGIAPAGPPVVVFHDRLVDGERWDIEICAPASRVGTPPSGFEFRELPGGHVVTTIHRGPYEAMEPAYRAMTEWMGEHDYEPAGAPREIYLTDPNTAPDNIETAIEWPVAMVAGGVRG